MSGPRRKTVIYTNPQWVWQAAQKEAARRCAEICRNTAWDDDSEAKLIEREFGLDTRAKT